MAENILSEMLDLLRQKAAELTSQEFFIIRIKLEESVQKMETFVKNNPLEMVGRIKQCLAIEQNLIEQAEQAEEQQHLNQGLAEKNQTAMVNKKIMGEIDNMQRLTVSTEHDLRTLKASQENFIIKYSDSHKITAQQQQIERMADSAEKNQKVNILKAEKEHLDQELSHLAAELLKSRIDLAKRYDATVANLGELQKKILDDELITWKRQQQLSGNGLVMDPQSLERLQNWCEKLAELIWQNRQQIKQLTQLQHQLPIKPEGDNLLPKLNDNITGLLSSIVTSTFIVEQQPPQVLKKDARFGAQVRLLVGGKLNVHMNPPQVKATIISESQAKDLLKNDVKAKDDVSGEILNNQGHMEYQHNTGQLSINFKNMQLKKIKRADKKGSEAVTEEKFCILFQSDFNVGGNELTFQVWTLSLPVVVTVHGNQECNATATVLWDNAFAEPGRVPFVVPDRVDWPNLADQLSIKFRSQTGKGLSDTNLQYIASKLFGNQDPTQCKVTWAQFNKDTLPNRTFTFWEWFYAIQKLTQGHLKELWTDEAITGFVSKNTSTEWLNSKPCGTFLLRFSDSEIGGITIAWTDNNGVWNLSPFTTKDFNIRCLADRVRDLNNLVFLYPSQPKDVVFSKYYQCATENAPDTDGYIKPELRTTIPGLNASSEAGDNMRAPFSPSSQVSGGVADFSALTPGGAAYSPEMPTNCDSMSALEDFEALDLGIPQDNDAENAIMDMDFSQYLFQ